MPLYECKICKFSTLLKSNYSNHLSSKKHILISQIKQDTDNEKTPKVEVAEFTCRYCDKLFTFRQSMNRHIKYSCTKKDDLSEVIRLLNLRFDQQETNMKMQGDQIEKLEKFICNLEIHDSFNTVIHNQHFHLKNLRENEESHFTDSELKSLFVKKSE